MSWDYERRPQDKPIPDVPLHHRARKDRRRWCKGKVGQEHVVDQLVQRYGKCTAWYRWPHPHGGAFVTAQWSCSHYRACSTCGKVMDKLEVAKCPDRPAVLPPPRQHPRITGRL